MSTEPDWVTAQREDSQRFANVWKGIWLGAFISGVFSTFVMSFRQDLSLSFGGYAFIIVLVVSTYLAIRSQKGSLLRSTAFTLAAFSCFAAIMFLFGGVEF